MNLLQRISVNEFIAQLALDHGLDDRAINVADIVEWVARALMVIRCPSVLELKYTEIKTEDYEAELPCGFYRLERIERQREGLYIPGAAEYDPTLVDTSKGKESSTLSGWNIAEGKLLSASQSEVYHLWYWAIPVDEQQMPTLPDNPQVIEALSWYVMWKRTLQTEKMSDGNKLAFLEAQWEKFCARARATLASLDAEAMQRVANNQTKFAGPDVDYYNRWGNLGTREHINWNTWPSY